MKIKDLIKKLKEYDSEKDIVIYSCDSDLIEYGPLGFYENEGQVELHIDEGIKLQFRMILICLLYTSPSPRDGLLSRMPSSA